MSKPGENRGYAGWLGVLMIVCAVGMCGVGISSLLYVHLGPGGDESFDYVYGWAMIALGAAQLAIAIPTRIKHRREGR